MNWGNANTNGTNERTNRTFLENRGVSPKEYS